MTHNTDTITTETYAAIGKLIITVLTATQDTRDRRVLDPARRDEIIRRLKEGQPYRTIAAEVKTSSKTIVRIAKELKRAE